MSLLSIAELRTLTGFNPRTILNKLEGYLDPVKSGTRTLYESTKALPLLYQTSVQAESEYKTERARLVFHQANVAELKEKTQRGALIPSEVVLRLGVRQINVARSRILAIHHKIRSSFPHVEVEVADEVERLSKRALRELGEYGVHNDLEEIIREYLEDMESAP